MEHHAASVRLAAESVWRGNHNFAGRNNALFISAKAFCRRGLGPRLQASAGQRHHSVQLVEIPEQPPRSLDHLRHAGLDILFAHLVQ